MGARAGGLASHEERQMTRLVSAAVNVTLEKLELKLKYFAEMEAVLQYERRELERARQQLFLDRLAFKRRLRQCQAGLQQAVATGGELGARAAQALQTDGERLAFQQQLQQPAGPSGPGMMVMPPQAFGEGQRARTFEA